VVAGLGKGNLQIFVIAFSHEPSRPLDLWKRGWEVRPTIKPNNQGKKVNVRGCHQRKAQACNRLGGWPPNIKPLAPLNYLAFYLDYLTFTPDRSIKLCTTSIRLKFSLKYLSCGFFKGFLAMKNKIQHKTGDLYIRLKKIIGNGSRLGGPLPS
jgi:hypothetical protein